MRERGYLYVGVMEVRGGASASRSFFEPPPVSLLRQGDVRWDCSICSLATLIVRGVEVKVLDGAFLGA